MQIILNGQSYRTQVATLEQLLSEQQIELGVVACAIDGNFIAKTQYSSVALQEGMRIEVLSPMQGG